MRKMHKWIEYAVAILVVTMPLAVYVIHFYDYPISENPSDWADFGSYIGGIYSIIVAILVVYLTRDLSKKDAISIKLPRLIQRT